MPENANVLIIRHAEKPDAGPDLSVAGQERAQAYSIYFQNYSVAANPIKLDYLFCSADSSKSHRPRLTITPLADVLNLTINDKHSDKDYAKVASDILGKKKYNNSNVLICWHHEEIPSLVEALGVTATIFPNGKWPGDVFGWVVQLSFDSNGNLTYQVINEELMYDDYGQNP